MRPDLRQSGPFLGLGGLAVAAFLYGYTAIALPSLLHSLVMPMVWLVLFVLACVWFSQHPVRVLLLSVVALAVWFALMLALGPSA